MEMGQPPAVQMADPDMWVRARQYTEHIVTITNDKIFDMPVYNYSWEFPYLWEEMQVMIKFSADRMLAEQILLEVAKRSGYQPDERRRSCGTREKMRHPQIRAGTESLLPDYRQLAGTLRQIHNQGFCHKRGKRSDESRHPKRIRKRRH